MKLFRHFAWVLCAALCACDSPVSGVDEHDLAIGARQLESIAGEAGWLAREVEARDVTLAMAWVHQQALGDEARKVAEDLGKPVPDALRAQHARLLALCMQLQAELARIAPAAGERETLQSLQRDFQAVVQSVRPLAEKA